MAPVGRPPAEHTFVYGMWVHERTGEPYNAETHGALVRDKKLACLRALYWERGGRTKRLNRYVKKRRPKAKQLTLENAAFWISRGGRQIATPAAHPPLSLVNAFFRE